MCIKIMCWESLLKSTQFMCCVVLNTLFVALYVTWLRRSVQVRGNITLKFFYGWHLILLHLFLHFKFICQQARRRNTLNWLHIMIYKAFIWSGLACYMIWVLLAYGFRFVLSFLWWMRISIYFCMRLLWICGMWLFFFFFG